MKKNIKSLIGVLLCLVMLMSLMGTAAFADDPVISPSFTKDEKWEETPGETYTGVLCWDPHYTAVKWKEIAGSEDFVSDGIWNEITELASGEDTITVSKLSAFLMIDYKTSENDEDGNQLVIDLNSTLLSQIAVAGEGYDMSKEYSTDGYTWKEYVDGYADLDGADKFFVRDKAMPTSAEASQFVLVSANTALDNVQYVAPLNEGEPIQDPNPENQNNETLNPENQNNETLNLENLNLGNPNQALNFQSLNLENLNPDTLNLVSLNQELQTNGNTNPGDTTNGNTNPGDTTNGNTNPGDTTNGNTNPGDTTNGNTNPGDTTNGNTNPGNQTGEDQTGGNQIGENQNQTLNLLQENQANENQILSDPPQATSYNIWVAGEEVTSAHLDGDNGDWSFNAQKNVLHIKKNIQATYNTVTELNKLVYDAAIYYSGTTALKIVADVAYSVEAATDANTQDYCFGIYSEGPLSLDGNLTVATSDAKKVSAAIYCHEGITIVSGANISADSGNAEITYGVFCGHNESNNGKILTVNGSLNAKSGIADELSYGIYTGVLAVGGNNAKVVSEAGNVENLTKGNGLNSGIYCAAELAQTDGTITATVGASTGSSYGIYSVGNISITKGTTSATGGSGYSYSEGLYTAAKLIIYNKGRLEAYSGYSDANCYGINAVNTISCSGILKAYGYPSTTDADNYGISVPALAFTGGEAYVESLGSNAIGISTNQESLTINGNAVLTVKSSADTAIVVAPTYSGYTPDAYSGADASSAQKIKTADLNDPYSYQKRYVHIEPIIPTTAIDLGENFSLGLNGTKTIEVKFTPETATDRELVWESSSPSIASVSASGTVTGLSKGTATIVAKLKSIQTIYDSVKVEVTTVPVNSITLDNYTLTIPQGETATVTYSIEPTTASEQRASVSSANTNVATVTGTGSSKTVTITGVNTGSTTINFETIDGKKTASCVVNVTAKTYVTGIAIADATGSTPKSITLTTKGAAQTLYAVVAPATATNKAVEWSVTGDNTVVYLTNKTDSSCVVNAYGNGTAVLTATAKDGSGKVATLNITVQDTQSTYKFTYKENSGVWYYDYGTLATYTVKCDGPYSSFSGCLMDGYIVSPSYYYVTEGSTIVTFYPAYMQTLSHGRHTLTFVYNGTTTVSTYIWSRSLRDPPITGDSGTAGLIAAMSVSALAAASCTFFVRKKRKTKPE